MTYDEDTHVVRLHGPAPGPCLLEPTAYTDLEMPMTTRLTTRRCRTAARHGLWVASLFVVMGGLFGMHGLADHGTGDMSAMAPAVTGTAAHPGDAHAFMPSLAPMDAVHTAVIAVVGATTEAATNGVEQPGQVATSGAPSGHLMMGLCLAVLGAGLLLLLALLVGRHARGFFMRVDMRRLLSPPVDRDPDPPSLAKLSIRRC